MVHNLWSDFFKYCPGLMLRSNKHNGSTITPYRSLDNDPMGLYTRHWLTWTKIFEMKFQAISVFFFRFIYNRLCFTIELTGVKQSQLKNWAPSQILHKSNLHWKWLKHKTVSKSTCKRKPPSVSLFDLSSCLSYPGSNDKYRVP